MARNDFFSISVLFGSSRKIHSVASMSRLCTVQCEILAVYVKPWSVYTGISFKTQACTGSTRTWNSLKESYIPSHHTNSSSVFLSVALTPVTPFTKTFKHNQECNLRAPRYRHQKLSYFHISYLLYSKHLYFVAQHCKLLCNTVL